MDNKKSNMEERKIELIKEIDSSYDFGFSIKDAIEHNHTVSDAFISMLDNLKPICTDDVDHWLEEHYYDLEGYIEMEYLNECPAFINVINLVNLELADDEYYFLEEKDVGYWLEEHYHVLEQYIKSGYLNEYASFLEVINIVNYVYAEHELEMLDEKIEELFYLVWGPKEVNA